MRNICMIAHSKTGQHWVLFLIANYHRILTENAKESISWESVMEFGKFEGNLQILAPNLVYRDGLPHLLRLEYPYSYSLEGKRFIDSCDKKVYLYRNPFDTMISMYYYFITNPEYIKQINESKDFKYHKYFEDFVKYRLEGYLSHIETSIDYVDLVLYYDDLKKDPSDFRLLLQLFYDDINEEIFQKALKMSSFEYVHKMEKKLKEGQKDVVFHARDGRSGQYHELMSTDLINYITKKWNDLKKRVKYQLK